MATGKPTKKKNRGAPVKARSQATATPRSSASSASSPEPTKRTIKVLKITSDYVEFSQRELSLQDAQRLDDNLISKITRQKKLEGKLIVIVGGDGQRRIVKGTGAVGGLSSSQRQYMAKYAKENMLGVYEPKASVSPSSSSTPPPPKAPRPKAPRPSQLTSLKDESGNVIGRMGTDSKGSVFYQNVRGTKQFSTVEALKDYNQKTAIVSAKRTLSRTDSTPEQRKAASEFLNAQVRQMQENLQRLSPVSTEKPKKPKKPKTPPKKVYTAEEKRQHRIAFKELKKNATSRVSWEKTGWRNRMGYAVRERADVNIKAALSKKTKSERTKIVTDKVFGERELKRIQKKAHKDAYNYVKEVAKGKIDGKRLTKQERKLVGTMSATGHRVAKKGETLPPSQYIDPYTGRVVYTSVTRGKARAQAQKDREKRQKARQNERKKEKARREREKEVRRRRSERNRKAHDRLSWKRKQQRRLAAFREQLKKDRFSFRQFRSRSRRYGKAPLRLIVPKDRFKRLSRGAVASKYGLGLKPKTVSERAKTIFPRAVLYPAMRHSSGSPLAPPVSLRSVDRLKLVAQHPGSTLAGGIGNIGLFGTDKTVTHKFANKFTGTPRGLFMSYSLNNLVDIDANIGQVMANLTGRFPKAVKDAIVGASDRIGRKMLDIVEPYVPKDTGLLYSTSQTNVDQMSRGWITAAEGIVFDDAECFGVSISYNAPYAEMVYFDTSKRHGEAYNEYHNVMTKGPKETARWIEVAFEKEVVSLRGLLSDYANVVTSALNKVGGRGKGK